MAEQRAGPVRRGTRGSRGRTAGSGSRDRESSGNTELFRSNTVTII